MNCKPGDIAIIISTEATDQLKLTGKIMKVISWHKKPDKDDTPREVWTFEDSPWMISCPCGCGARATMDVFPDMFLRPLRDPGDDAVDEISRVKDEVTA